MWRTYLSGYKMVSLWCDFISHHLCIPSLDFNSFYQIHIESILLSWAGITWSVHYFTRFTPHHSPQCVARNHICINNFHFHHCRREFRLEKSHDGSTEWRYWQVLDWKERQMYVCCHVYWLVSCTFVKRNNIQWLKEILLMGFPLIDAINLIFQGKCAEKIYDD